MPDAERIQAQLRYSATEAFDAIPSPPFTIFINPDDDTPHNNYAIPDVPTGGDLHRPLAELRAIFHARPAGPLRVSGRVRA